MRLGLFGPSQEEIDEVARDLIHRHGLNAYDEAVRLSEVARNPPSLVSATKNLRAGRHPHRTILRDGAEALAREIGGRSPTPLDWVSQRNCSFRSARRWA